MIKRIVTGKWQENCYVIDDSGTCIVIDPGDDEDRIIEYIDASRFEVVAIINTHGHFDHAGAVSALKKRYQAPFYLHHADLKQLKRAGFFCAVLDSGKRVVIPDVDFDLNGKEDLVIDKYLLDVIETPGHTKGSVCLSYNGMLFTGDTLLKGMIGRTNLPGGDRIALRCSLRLICAYPEETVIYPGHGDITTLADELRNNAQLLEVLHEHQN